MNQYNTEQKIEKMTERLEMIVTGRVQGVNYRDATVRTALECGLLGTVKNLPDGTVEIVAEGGKAGLRRLLDWCYKGSFLSHVDGLSFKWLPASDSFDKFAKDTDGKGVIADQVSAFKNLGKRIVNKVTGVAKGPKHVVIIMDGNRRWAKERNLPAWEGHAEGAKRVKELVESLQSSPVENLTLWAFSTENWARPVEEVTYLMDKIRELIRDFRDRLIKNKIGFKHLGRKDRLPKDIILSLTELEEITAGFKSKRLSIALDYGGRDEILRAIDKLPQGVKVDEETFRQALDTHDLPDPDLIIRTSGEQRLSGMMPWQGTYAELFFSPLYFPDFTIAEFALALDDYALRGRRLGK